MSLTPWNSRTADKFVVRGYASLFVELSNLAKQAGRSRNSEAVAALSDALLGFKHTNGLLHILKQHIGPETADQLLAQVPEIKPCGPEKKLILRFPNDMRSDVALAQSELKGSLRSMNSWMLDALEKWVVHQRQIQVLMDAAIDGRGQYQ